MTLMWDRVQIELDWTEACHDEILPPTFSVLSQNRVSGSCEMLLSVYRLIADESQFWSASGRHAFSCDAEQNTSESEPESGLLPLTRNVTRLVHSVRVQTINLHNRTTI